LETAALAMRVNFAPGQLPERTVETPKGMNLVAGSVPSLSEVMAGAFVSMPPPRTREARKLIADETKSDD
jgi:hypothetical protein